MRKNNSLKTVLQSSLNICLPRKMECLGEDSYQKHMYELKYGLFLQIKTSPKHSGGRNVAVEIFK